MSESLCMKRMSIRKFQKREVADSVVEKLLRSAMQAPSARNQQPWRFIVIKNRELLTELGGISQGAWPLKEAAVAILTLIDVPEGGRKVMCPQDLSAATQNILLEAVHQGLGGVWIGVYPLEERMEKVERIVQPETGTPFSLIALGYPNEEKELVPRFAPAKVQVID